MYYVSSFVIFTFQDERRTEIRANTNINIGVGDYTGIRLLVGKTMK